ncbi:cysteine--tRNA ligase [Candidatus Roizmanbacteria bacterium CG_4_10_14_0_2_um_filter_39_13]|uniref:Cysteine--tRNA ligase n=1 Tax=Candidatus Roizmanbacteria bacterium CG_4_10_14_0_2_um_filter_39_13 TaxID=1974825 RepID=A0A2M7TWE9_9BACT|nr:MAG: cysteine--tRNA ligase [Candidatus Roizmanbacteria bacterium CG_4_10_14_0_2_um_filter_39_13]
MKLYNTLTREKDELPAPILQKSITMYSCGPTVYDETHIGHMRKFTMDDVLKRSLRFLGYEVKHVMNITDVGHLTGDDDSGEDKLEKGAKKQGKTVWDVAKEYEEKFWDTMKALKIDQDDIIVMHATQCIDDMIALNKKLEEKGFTYQTDEALYFDVTMFDGYGKLSGQKMEDKKQAVRSEVNIDPGKKHPADFALWFKKVGRFADHTMHWESPWGDGFPGWHIECSAMAMKGLQSETIDIHTGGIDHIPVHHENEIAQSEAATGKPFVRWWVHHAFLQVDGEKMSKSKGNFYTLKDLYDRKVDPLTLKYLFLQTHYRKPMNFTWEAAQAAAKAYEQLQSIYYDLKQQANGTKITHAQDLSGTAQFMLNTFKKDISDDLNTARLLGNVWYMLKEEKLKPEDQLFLLDHVNTIFGFNLSGKEHNESIPDEIQSLADQRLQARTEKDFQKSDDLRKQIENNGYTIEDTNDGYVIKKK